MTLIIDKNDIGSSFEKIRTNTYVHGSVKKDFQGRLL